MTIKSGIFNSVNGDRKYKADDFASYFATFISNGVFPNPSTGFQVVTNGDMTVSLKAGKAWIKGYYITNDADFTLTIGVADGVLNRIDRIVLRLDYLNRMITPLVKKGSFASSPVAPQLQRDADAYELALADIYISKGSISILQANITDLRLNKDLCGMVHSTVDQVDTTTIFNQYQSWFNNMKTGKEADFDQWFQSIRDILDTNAAGNLQNQIDDLAQTDTEMREYSMYKSGKDPDGIFTTVELKRANGTLYLKSVLSSGIAPLYTTRTATWYENDGTTIYRQKVYSRTYDGSGTLVSEVLV
ncbi:hypothetical protein [Peribacillus loiseleuriae]|uniref:Uncharacterized protein n=1 Tax=Peribacillus loiseleuriae TaxID=1679170 RepID=A0A0K9GSF7_9BACI|nr:hypothetical protein [Peribacillus loiseleuriae]KMY49573.1 hypothetical protein AC625_08470 [Peribacillus loiseleuriae]